MGFPFPLSHPLPEKPDSRSPFVTLFSFHVSTRHTGSYQLSDLLISIGLQPIPRDPKDNGVAAMLDDRTFCFVIQHGRHSVLFFDLQGLVANHLLRSDVPRMIPVEVFMQCRSVRIRQVWFIGE